MNLYHIDTRYCHYLRRFDEKVPYNEGRKKRPFIGIVITIHAVDFFAPLTSPKQKHRKMHDRMDFIKMDQGRLGAINLNNMIPVAQGLFQRVNLDFNAQDQAGMRDYKLLLRRQNAWCNEHRQVILQAAVNLYLQITLAQAPMAVQARCCNFYRDMLLLKEYCQFYYCSDDSIVQDIDVQMQWLLGQSYRADQFRIHIS